MYADEMTGTATEDCTIVRVYVHGDTIRHEHADGADHDDDARPDCWPAQVPAGTFVTLS